MMGGRYLGMQGHQLAACGCRSDGRIVLPGTHSYSYSARLMQERVRDTRRIGIRAEADTGKAELLRLLPLTAGAVGIASVLLNRISSGIEPSLLASSSQSRADVLVIFISAVLALSGLQWLSLKPKVPPTVELIAEPVDYVSPELSFKAQKELKAAWMAIDWATKAKMMVVFHKGKCIMHMGCMLPGHVPAIAQPGPICTEAQRHDAANYLANLTLFPGRAEFYSYLPINTQSVIVQPCGTSGVIVVGAASQRGFTTLDQAWISAWNDKIEVALNED